MGSEEAPWKILVLDPMLGWADPPMVLCMIFTHAFFGHDGFLSMVLDTMVFRSMVLDAWTCINMYYNIERNIMKNQSGSPDFGIQGKISMYMCFMYYALAFFIFCVLEFICR